MPVLWPYVLAMRRWNRSDERSRLAGMSRTAATEQRRVEGIPHVHNCITSAGTPPRTPPSHALRLAPSEPARPVSSPPDTHAVSPFHDT